MKCAAHSSGPLGSDPPAAPFFGGHLVSKIHPLAIVDPAAEIGRDVRIGPFCVIEAGVRIGDECQFESHVVVKSGTELGPRNHVFEGTVLGGVPQHARHGGDCGRLVIGAGNTIREHVTMHRGMHADSVTVVGDNNLIMVGVHFAHDCRIGNNTIFTNNAGLAGHVEVQDRAYVSGQVGVHQYCRIGRLAMVGGQAHVVKDIPPFVTVDGATTLVVGLNLVGLRRAGFSSEDIQQLKEAYRVIYRSGLSWKEILMRLKRDFQTGPAAEFHEFFMGGTRGFTPERRFPVGRPTLKLREAAEDEGPDFQALAG